ncbi:unnamed protein product [Camellia sinensis]
MSGLKINFHKSQVCGIGVQDDLVKEFAAGLNCHSQKLPMKYLGLPLGANPRRKSTGQPVVDKFKKKLALWKRKCLSFAGRLTLIRSVLSSLPVYFLFLFKMLVGIARSIDKIQSNFLWGGTELRRKIHPVSWKEACLSKLQRKLGVKNLRKVNDCLLIKWWWRYGREENASWKQVLCSKYGGIGGRWSPFPVDSDVMSILWQDILSMKFTNPALSELYFNDVKIVVGNGKRIQFWVDRWFNNQSLSEIFPRLFSLSTEKGCSLLYFFHKK